MKRPWQHCVFRLVLVCQMAMLISTGFQQSRCPAQSSPTPQSPGSAQTTDPGSAVEIIISDLPDSRGPESRGPETREPERYQDLDADEPDELLLEFMTQPPAPTMTARPASGRRHSEHPEAAPANHLQPEGNPVPMSKPPSTGDSRQVALPVAVPLKGVPADPDAEAVIVVCPPDFLSALAPWIEYRQEQGYHLVHVDSRLTSVEILTTIRKYAIRRPVSYVVLVGDADLQMALYPAIRKVSVPTFVVASEINAELGVEAHIATDNPYGDLNGDFMPDIAVGRISVDTPEQLSLVVKKIIDYESMPRSGEWRRSIQLAAGVGDFGLIADTIIETAAKKLLTDGIPAEYRTKVTYGNWRSPFCPDPRLFREHMLMQVERGCLFWVYMGHGRARRLDRFKVGNLLIPVLEARDARRFRSSNGMPIAVMLACYTGAFEQPRDCLAEELLRVPNGPVAVLASSRVAMPYSMSVLGTSLMDAVFRDPSTGKNATTGKAGKSSDKPYRVLGDVVLSGKRALASQAAGGKNRKLMDSLARTLSPTKEKLPLERREHTLMFNLLGDPLLRIQVPRRLEVLANESASAGETITIRGKSPIAGRCVVELCCRRDRLTFDWSRRRNLAGGHEDLVAMNQTYAQANNQTWVRRNVDVRKGGFAVNIKLPVGAKGPAHARVFVDSGKDMALGATDIYIRQAGDKSGLRTSNAER